jgi:hypothetical protein
MQRPHAVERAPAGHHSSKGGTGSTPAGSRTLAAPEAVLQLQRTAGNRAVASLVAQTPRNANALQVQRWPSWEDVVDAVEWTNPLTFSGKVLKKVTGVEPNLFMLAEQAVRASATRISIPQGHIDALKKYAQANKADGRLLLNALDQEPKFYKGGWLLGVQGDAEAITFGNSIFFKDSPPTVQTFVHEMVHIDQYDRLGRSAFLASYFGLSLATIIKRAIAGDPIEVMNSSPHEREAYELEKRFIASPR